MSQESHFIETAKKQMAYYKNLGEKAIAQLLDQELFNVEHDYDNSIAIIVGHLHGNMRSRWTDFLSSDGEKSWRKRDQEFEALINDRKDLMAHWEEGWLCVFTALDQINTSNINEVVYIRNQGHSIIEAVSRQLCHYSYHVGQIVHIAKSAKKESWESLSIPKGNSQNFNDRLFSKEKKRGHFTDKTD